MFCVNLTKPNLQATLVFAASNDGQGKGVQPVDDVTANSPHLSYAAPQGKQKKEVSFDQEVKDVSNIFLRSPTPHPSKHDKSRSLSRQSTGSISITSDRSHHSFESDSLKAGRKRPYPDSSASPVKRFLE